MLYGITRGWSGVALTASTGTSMTVDISGATVGETVYAWVNWRLTALVSETFTGWVTVQPYQNVAGNGGWALYKRLKAAGDTTFTLSWTTSGEQCLVLLQQWPGTVADESSVLTPKSAAGSVFITNTISPTDGNRWFVGLYSGLSGNTSLRTLGWTAAQDTPTLVTSASNVNGTLAWLNGAVCDSNGPVANASHTGEGDVTTGSANVGSALGMFLIPASSYQPTSVLQAVNRTAVI